MKELLASGQAVAFSGHIIKGYGAPKLDGGVLYDSAIAPKGGHGQLLVGYDDARGRVDAPGAFLVQNSEGGDWPAPDGNGYIWISYDAFVKTQMLGATAYPRDPSPPTGEMLHAEGGAPAGSITRAYQWSPEDRTVLVLQHHFAEPILIRTMTLTTPRGRSITATLNLFVHSGYTHFARRDWMSFPSGAWKVKIAGEDAKGANVTYTGSMSVGDPGAHGTRRGAHRCEDPRADRQSRHARVRRTAAEAPSAIDSIAAVLPLQTGDVPTNGRTDGERSR